MKIQDYYDLLGVARDASFDDLKRAYRQLVLQWHPDRHFGAAKDSAEARFKEITEAYETLSDPARRRDYDDDLGDDSGMFFAPSFRRSTHRGDAGPQFEDAFAELFDPVHPAFQHAPFPTADARWQQPDPITEIMVDCAIDVTRLITDRCATIALPPPARCRCGSHDGRLDDQPSTRERTLEVALPDLAHDGMMLDLRGITGCSCRRECDVIVTLRIESDANYRLEGTHVHAFLPVAPWEAALGARVAVRSPAGDLLVSIPEHSHNGTRLRLAGKGLPDAEGQRGDFYLTLILDLPSLSDRQRSLLRAAADGPEPALRGGVRIE